MWNGGYHHFRKHPNWGKCLFFCILFKQWLWKHLKTSGRLFFLQTGSIAEEWSSIITLPPQFKRSSSWLMRLSQLASWYILLIFQKSGVHQLICIGFPIYFRKSCIPGGWNRQISEPSTVFPNFEIGKAAFRTKEDEDGLIEVPISVWKLEAASGDHLAMQHFWWWKW